jgi:hypothetical protein
MRKEMKGERGARSCSNTTANMNQMDKKVTRLFNNVSVARKVLASVFSFLQSSLLIDAVSKGGARGYS